MLSVVVQHHPSRAALLPGLAALGEHEVVVDPDPDGRRSAIRTYIECLRSLPTSHRLVVQDDAVPHHDFRARAEAAVAERPDTLVALFVPGTGLHGVWMRLAAKEGATWQQLPPSANWVPTVALVWPRDLAEAFVPFAEEHVARRRERGMGTLGDDPVVGAFRREHQLQVWATVPCLVEHPDHVESLVKRRSYAGRYPARRAAVYASE